MSISSQHKPFGRHDGAKPVVVIGAGVGGLCAAIELAVQGVPVLLLESASGPGGKIRQIEIDQQRIDAGPTVLTMRWVFEELFDRAGARLDDFLASTRLDVLARHCWPDGSVMDLFADTERSADAVGQLAGAQEAERFRAFCDRTARLYAALAAPYLLSAKPANPLVLALRAGPMGMLALARAAPLNTLWRALGQQFRDPRLQQLFGRYATYCGSSPFLAPSTLMLIAHVEQAGVWKVEGGMQALAHALAELARQRGVVIRYGATVQRIETQADLIERVHLADGESIAARAVVYNGEAGALAAGLLGADVRDCTRAPGKADRSLSAMTWNLLAEVSGFELQHHTVFFARSSRSEFDDLFVRRRVASDPTVYVCAMDRGGVPSSPHLPAARSTAMTKSERLFCLINAPASGDREMLTELELEQCERTMIEKLARSGLRLQFERQKIRMTTPHDFSARFPGSQGALYGRSTHGWMSSFRRPASRSKISNLYLTGAGVHPGAGLPMVALSGRQAALSLLADLASSRQFQPVATVGGTLISSPTMAVKD
jgi:1-hydroxycarotenoid 3,4-desaturase